MAIDHGSNSGGNGFNPGGGGSGGGGGGGSRWRSRELSASLREPINKLFDRPRPNAPEAEMSLLGAMILDPRVIADILGVLSSDEMFYHEGHRKLFQTVRALADKHSTIDPVMLEQALRDEGVLEMIGGSVYIEQIVERTSGPTFAVHHARVIAEKHKLRKLIDAASEILYEAYHGGAAEGPEVKLLIDAAEQKIFEIAQEEQVTDIKSLEELLHEEYERLLKIDMGQGAPAGVMTGFADLDRMLGGLQPSEMIILAARPSVGKTSFAMNMAEQIALGTDQPGSTRAAREPTGVGVFSLEMSRNSLAQRMLSSWTGLSSQQLRSGHLPKDGHQLILDASQQLGKAPIYIDDTPGLTLMSMRARARRMVERYKVKALMLDYLQLLSAPGSAKESRQVEVGAISRGLKALARELRVPIIALSQLNRGPEAREDGKPRLADLRESGSLEQDADVVLLLHRDAAHHKNDPDWEANNPDKINTAECIIAKQRNGPLGVVNLIFDGGTTRFKTADGSGQSSYGVPQYTPPRPVERGPEIVTRPPPAPMSGPSDRVGGFVSGPKTGPVSNFRDGGGPMDDEPDEPAPF